MQDSVPSLADLASALRGPMGRNPNAWMAYASRLSQAGWGADLKSALASAVMLVPRSELGRFQIQAARLLMDAWLYDDALPYWRAALRQKDLADRAAVGMAATLERLNRIDEAVQYLPSLEKQDRTLALHARVLRRTGDLDAALSRLSRLDQPDPAIPPALAAEAWHERYLAYDQAGDFASAWDALQRSKQWSRQSFGPDRIADWQAHRRLTFARVNAAMAQLDRDRVSRWVAEGDRLQCRPWFLMLGMPRSGTTLLENLLESNPRVVGTDERDALARVVFEPLVNQYRPDATAGTDAGVIGRGFLQHLEDVSPDTVQAAHRQYLGELQKQLGRPIDGDAVLLDKNPGLMESVCLMPRLCPGVKLIVPIREPRAVAWSTYQVFIREPKEVSLFWLMPDDVVEIYDQTMNAWRRMRDLLPQDRWIETRYESVVADVATEGRRVTEFMGLSWQAAQSQPHEHAGRKLVRSPTYAEVAKAAYAGANEKWRRYEQWIGPVLERLNGWTETLGYR